MIPTYNPRAEYLEETLWSVLRQDPGPEQMQIEVVDDYSKDDTASDYSGMISTLKRKMRRTWQVFRRKVIAVTALFVSAKSILKLKVPGCATSINASTAGAFHVGGH